MPPIAPPVAQFCSEGANRSTGRPMRDGSLEHTHKPRAPGRHPSFPTKDPKPNPGLPRLRGPDRNPLSPHQGSQTETRASNTKGPGSKPSFPTMSRGKLQNIKTMGLHLVRWITMRKPIQYASDDACTQCNTRLHGSCKPAITGAWSIHTVLHRSLCMCF